MWLNINGNWIGRNRGGTSWSSYWSSLISATVENAAPTHVVLTFPTAKTALGATDFTIAGFTISSASWTGAVLTLVLSTAVLVYDEDLTITFIQTGQTATVTNNVADDGNTVAWYDSTDLTTITKDGSDFVSKWEDKLGSGHDLLQATGTKQPLYQSTGILFDGVDNCMKTAAFTLNQPEIIYLVFKSVTWTNDEYFIDGNANDSRVIYQRGATPQIAINAGALVNYNNAATIGSFHIMVAQFNGASSKLRINDTTVTGNYGANNAGGITMGSRASQLVQFSNVEFKEAIFRNAVDNASDEAAIYAYLKAKYSL